MRARTMLGVAAAAVLVVSACGSDEASISERSDPTTEITDGGGSDAPDATPTVPDPGEVEDAMSDMFGEDCGAAMATWSSMMGSMFGGELTEEQQQQFDDFRADVPDEIADDVALYEEYVNALVEDGMVAAGELADDPKFEEAGRNISAWFEENCNVGG